ncbi:hypothetical protein PINS_up023781 [Pythium insidiosum]|nr:hypothetical protein PINS_up015350 [Pythium insidiosum]GLE09783.1 hypothetical protein PINS_up021623 [Pythium insidiosum]GLE11394.1 hypothetical protein PINS_up023781 [Pythium insidiosum]
MEDPFVNSGHSVFMVCGVVFVVLGIVSIGVAVFLRRRAASHDRERSTAPTYEATVPTPPARATAKASASL